MYILFNSENKACLNVGNDTYGAFDCWLAGNIISGSRMSKSVADYFDDFRTHQYCNCDNVYVFNSRLYCIVNDEIKSLAR